MKPSTTTKPATQQSTPSLKPKTKLGKVADFLSPAARMHRMIKENNLAHAQKIGAAASNVSGEHSAVAKPKSLIKKLGDSIYSSERAKRVREERAIAKAAGKK